MELISFSVRFLNIFLIVLQSDIIFSVAGVGGVQGPDSHIEFKQKGDAELSCENNPVNSEDKSSSFTWTKDGKVVEESEHIKITKGKLKIVQGGDEQAGNYTCSILERNQTTYTKLFIVYSEPYVKLQGHANVVEDEKLKIECTVLGKPTPAIKWRYNDTLTDVSTERVKLMENKDHVPNAMLVLDKANKGDKGNYQCIAVFPYEPTKNMTVTTVVYVKGKLDALWPFLGIVAEVVVLCAIILIYEKKRNNNAELEESDTDQSPDQKNTPDHGKDSVRHRK